MARPTAKQLRDHPASSGRAVGLDALVELAKKVVRAADAPIVGGVAVVLHGGGRHTRDIDIYTDDFWATHEKLEAAGILWDSAGREHRLDGVPVHMVGPEQMGGPPKRVSMISGVRVISLADLVRIKLTLGLKDVKRSKDLAHVIDLISAVPLRKDFAAKLPTKLRGPFKELIEQVHGPRRAVMPPGTYRKKHR